MNIARYCNIRQEKKSLHSGAEYMFTDQQTGRNFPLKKGIVTRVLFFLQPFCQLTNSHSIKE